MNSPGHGLLNDRFHKNRATESPQGSMDSLRLHHHLASGSPARCVSASLGSEKDINHHRKLHSPVSHPPRPVWDCRPSKRPGGGGGARGGSIGMAVPDGSCRLVIRRSFGFVRQKRSARGHRHQRSASSTKASGSLWKRGTYFAGDF